MRYVGRTCSFEKEKITIGNLRAQTSLIEVEKLSFTQTYVNSYLDVRPFYGDWCSAD